MSGDRFTTEFYEINQRKRALERGERAGPVIGATTTPDVSLLRSGPPAPREFSIKLPFPPLVNALYRPAYVHRNSRIPFPRTQEELVKLLNTWLHRNVLTDEQVKFRRNVASIVACRGEFAPLRGRLHADIVGYPRNPAIDADAPIKALFDALQHARVYANDNKIRSYTVNMIDGTDIDEVHVTVMERE